jgi:hypothetical protein
MTDADKFKRAMDAAWAATFLDEGAPVMEVVCETPSFAVKLTGVGDDKCPAEARTGNSMKPSGPHTHRCQKPAGHDGAHEWSNGAGRTVIWYGEARKQEDDTRYRYGLRPGWQMW